MTKFYNLDLCRVSYCPISQFSDFCTRCYFCSYFRTVINTLRYKVCALVSQVCPDFSGLAAVHSSLLLTLIILL